MLEPFVETLTHLHGKGFIHGRIKPGNILAIDDQLKLSSDSLSRIGEPQILLGKPDAYTAPEGAAAGSPAGDVWSLGVTLVETLTQHLPEQKDQEELQVSDSVPQPFLDIARHSLRRDPQSRWTVAEISARLNPPAPKVSAPAIPDPIKPAGGQAITDCVRRGGVRDCGANETCCFCRPVVGSTLDRFPAASVKATRARKSVGRRKRRVIPFLLHRSRCPGSANARRDARHPETTRPSERTGYDVCPKSSRGAA